MRVIGYAVCGPDQKYLENTLKEFKRLCNETVICLNKAGDKELKLVKKYGFKYYRDDREWGTSQHLIKQNLIDNHLRVLSPDWLICLDTDEVLDPDFTREYLEEIDKVANSLYFFIVNLWDAGCKMKLCFWNIRAWKWQYTISNEVKRAPLHCGLSPQWAYFHGICSPFILRHYGLKDKTSRDSKIKRYEKYDKNAQYISKSYYDTLKETDFDEYDEAKIKEQIKKEYTKPLKPKFMSNKKNLRFGILYRESDGANLDIPESQVKETLDRGGFKFVRWIDDKPADLEVIPPAKEVEAEEILQKDEPLPPLSNDLECKECGYVAKTKAGLKVHAKKHI